jgi:hypothetical protein
MSRPVAIRYPSPYFICHSSALDLLSPTISIARIMMVGLLVIFESFRRYPQHDAPLDADGATQAAAASAAAVPPLAALATPCRNPSGVLMVPPWEGVLMHATSGIPKGGTCLTLGRSAVLT